MIIARVSSRLCQVGWETSLQWIDWFNKERLLESLGYIKPIEAEEKDEQALKPNKIAAWNINSVGHVDK